MKSTFKYSYPDIHFAGEEPLGDSECVEESARDVEESHEDQPAQTGLRHRPLQS